MLSLSKILRSPAAVFSNFCKFTFSLMHFDKVSLFWKLGNCKLRVPCSLFSISSCTLLKLGIVLEAPHGSSTKRSRRRTAGWTPRKCVFGFFLWSQDVYAEERGARWRSPFSRPHHKVDTKYDAKCLAHFTESTSQGFTGCSPACSQLVQSWLMHFGSGVVSSTFLLQRVVAGMGQLFGNWQGCHIPMSRNRSWEMMLVAICDRRMFSLSVFAQLRPCFAIMWCHLQVDNNFYQMPERWLEATGECFVLCIGVSWLVTAMFNPGVAALTSSAVCSVPCAFPLMPWKLEKGDRCDRHLQRQYSSKYCRIQQPLRDLAVYLSCNKLFCYGLWGGVSHMFLARSDLIASRRDMWPCHCWWCKLFWLLVAWLCSASFGFIRPAHSSISRRCQLLTAVNYQYPLAHLAPRGLVYGCVDGAW